MKIDSIFDYQNINCCPCVYPAPVGDIQQVVDTIAGFGSADGFVDFSDSVPEEDRYLIQYKQSKETYKPTGNIQGHITTRTYDDIYSIVLGNERLSPPIKQTVEESGGNSFAQPSEVSLALPVDWATSRSHIIGVLDGAKDFAGPDVAHDIGAFGVSLLWTPTIFTPYFEGTTKPSGPSVDIRYMRYKLRFNADAQPDIKYFRLEYDLVFLPTEWDFWYREVLANAAQKQAHETWELCMANNNNDPLRCGPEPELPPPDPPEPVNRPELIHHKTFEFTGGTGNVDTEFTEIEPRDISVVGGTMGFYNAKYYSYRSTRLGSVPQPFTPTIPIGGFTQP